MIFCEYLIISHSRFCVDRVLCSPKLGIEVSNELVNIVSTHALKFRTGMIYIAILKFFQPTTAEEQ